MKKCIALFSMFLLTLVLLGCWNGKTSGNLLPGKVFAAENSSAAEETILMEDGFIAKETAPADKIPDTEGTIPAENGSIAKETASEDEIPDTEGTGPAQDRALPEESFDAEESFDTEENASAPIEENWETAPDYSSPSISTTSIRYLSVTAGGAEGEIYLTWFSPSGSAGQVLWTTADDTEFENAAVYSASAAPSQAIEGCYVNRAAVSGLIPGTEYLYQVGNDDAMSPVYAYTAADFSDNFRFTAVGDAQLGKPMEELEGQRITWHKVLNKIKYHFPDSGFLVSLGDQVNDFNESEQYDAFLDQGVLYGLPLAPVKGNHDMGGPQYSEHFTLPNQSPLGVCDDDGDGDYWFVRGNALFLVLDTMDLNRWGEHREFIAAAVEANPDCKWRIVFSHFSPYNSYEGYLENAENIRPYFLDFTEAYDIDLVMCGHDHCYTRTHFIQEDGSYIQYDSPAVSPEGTMYLTLSSSSGSLYKRPTAQNEAAVSGKREAPEVTDVQVSQDSLKVCTYNAETWEMMDEFEIRK